MLRKVSKKQKKVKIAFVDKFTLMHNGEYIAQGFEKIGCDVLRIETASTPQEIREALLDFSPDVLLFCKWIIPAEIKRDVDKLCKAGMVTVCWIFDLYFGYHREYQINTMPFFRANYVFTTDGGHQKEFKAHGVNHHVLRQGIRSEDCFLHPGNPQGVVFVGSYNVYNKERIKEINYIKSFIREFHWYGLDDTNEIRGVALNKLYGNTKIVIGDSVYSPYYWSNRVVETLGRGGFLIHADVEGIHDEHPYLVTYRRGDQAHLRNMIIHYLNNEKERMEIVQKNYEYTKAHHLIEHRCQDLLNTLQ